MDQKWHKENLKFMDTQINLEEGSKENQQHLQNHIQLQHRLESQPMRAGDTTVRWQIIVGAPDFLGPACHRALS